MRQTKLIEFGKRTNLKVHPDSEAKLAKALKDGYREKVILSTKWSPWHIKVEHDDQPTADCTYKRICESMQRLEVGYLDFYQIWSTITKQHWKLATQPSGMLDGILRAKNEGLIGNIGFTTHQPPKELMETLDHVIGARQY